MSKQPYKVFEELANRLRYFSDIDDCDWNKATAHFNNRVIKETGANQDIRSLLEKLKKEESKLRAERKRATCPKCKGEGSVKDEYYGDKCNTPPECDGWTYKKCPECGGTGLRKKYLSDLKAKS